MATRLFFHNAVSSLPGTFPAGEQAAVTPNVTATGAATIRVMDTNIGTAQTTINLSTSASTAQRTYFIRTFCSPPLSGNQSVGQQVTLNAADQESNTNANFWINTANIYIWRPSTGSLIYTITDSTGAVMGGSEPSAANSLQVSHIGPNNTNGAFTALDGDVIICEVWARTTQSQATSYTCLFAYDGTTINTTENAVVTNHASFLEFPENLVFGSSTGDFQFDPYGMNGIFGI